MRKVVFVGAVLAVLAPVASGDEAVEIKLAMPKVGERVKVTVEEKGEGKTTLTAKANGNTQDSTDKKGKSFVYVDETLTVAPGADKPTKLKRTYEKAVTSTGDKSTTLPIEGKTVLIEKSGDKYKFTIGGKDVEGEAAKLLDGEFNGPDVGDLRTVLPNKPVKPGDTWTIESDKLAKVFDDSGLTLDKTKLQATGKLIKAYKVGDAQFGALELKISVSITEHPKLKVKEGNISVTVSADACIDGTSPKGKNTAVTKVSFSGSGNGFEVSLDSTTTEYRTMEPLKK